MENKHFDYVRFTYNVDTTSMDVLFSRCIPSNLRFGNFTMQSCKGRERNKPKCISGSKIFVAKDIIYVAFVIFWIRSFLHNFIRRKQRWYLEQKSRKLFKHLFQCTAKKSFSIKGKCLIQWFCLKHDVRSGT